VPVAIAAWPSGEFGAMGLEGAVKLGFRKELEAAPDEAAREALFQRLLQQAIDRGQALKFAQRRSVLSNSANSRSQCRSAEGRW
jgi:acetyl-CoA carboxylase carboxyltransferase component